MYCSIDTCPASSAPRPLPLCLLMKWEHCFSGTADIGSTTLWWIEIQGGCPLLGQSVAQLAHFNCNGAIWRNLYNHAFFILSGVVWTEKWFTIAKFWPHGFPLHWPATSLCLDFLSSSVQTGTLLVTSVPVSTHHVVPGHPRYQRFCLHHCLCVCGRDSCGSTNPTVARNKACHLQS